MKTVHKSVLIWYSPQEMFDLVTQVQHYPEFLPWCDHAAVLECTQTGMVAEVGLALGGIRQTFVTRNTHEPGRRVQVRTCQTGRSRSSKATGSFTPWATARSARAASSCGCITAFRTGRSRRWWARCSTVSPTVWSMPSCSAPRRSMADTPDALIPVTVVVCLAPRSVRELELQLPAGATVADRAARERCRCRAACGCSSRRRNPGRALLRHLGAQSGAHAAPRATRPGGGLSAATNRP